MEIYVLTEMTVYGNGERVVIPRAFRRLKPAGAYMEKEIDDTVERSRLEGVEPVVDREQEEHDAIVTARGFTAYFDIFPTVI